MMHRLLVPALVLALFSHRASAAPAVDPLPTQDDIKKTYDAGDYPKTLQKLNRVLILKGKAAEPYDRHELLRIKGEVQLHLKAATAAAQAFGEAAKEAPDGPATAQDLATELLLKRSGANLQYQPKAKDPNDKTKPLPPVGVLEPADRKKAIELLYADERVTVEAQVKPLKDSKQLAPILAALPAIRNVRWLEIAATGHDERSKAMVSEIADKTKKLLDDALKDMGEKTDDVERAASEVTTAHVPINDKQTGKLIGFRNEYKYRGPNAAQMSTLQGVVTDCTKIFTTCDELGGSLGSTGKEFDAAKGKAKEVGGKAEGMVKYNWRATFETPPPTLPPKKP